MSVKSNLPTDIREYPEITHSIGYFLKTVAKKYKDEATFHSMCAFFKRLSEVSETNFGGWILLNCSNAYHKAVSMEGKPDYDLYIELHDLMNSFLYYIAIDVGGKVQKEIMEYYE